MILTKFILEYPVNEEETLLINTLSGALDLADKKTYNYMQNLKRGIEIDDEDTLKILKERGYVFDDEAGQQSVLDRYNKIFMDSIDNREISEFIICPTMGCNLKCIYCFEDELHNSKCVMSDEVLDAILNKIVEQKSKNKDSKPTITVFGGEPLLKTNRHIISKILEFSKENKVKTLIVTNGTTIDFYLDELKEFNKQCPKTLSLQITLDGNNDIHDKRRVRRDGSGTYNEIIDGIDLLVKNDIDTIVRINVDKENIDFIGDIEKLILSYKWNQKKCFLAYISPVLDFKLKSPTVFKESELLQKVIDKYPNILNGTGVISNITSNTIPFVSSFLDKKNDMKPWKISFCQATGGSTYVFAPDGSIVTCLNYAGTEKYSIGKIVNGEIVINTEEAKKWSERSVFRIPKCRSCKYALVCGGGCPVESIENNQDIDLPICSDIENVMNVYVESIKKRFITSNTEV